MKPADPYTLRTGEKTHPLLPNHRDRPSCGTCRFEVNGGRACGYLRARHQTALYPHTKPSSICDNWEDDSGIPF
jgi:hypothetical protein